MDSQIYRNKQAAAASEEKANKQNNKKTNKYLQKM